MSSMKLIYQFESELEEEDPLRRIFIFHVTVVVGISDSDSVDL